jgi:hypothetical protein
MDTDEAFFNTVGTVRRLIKGSITGEDMALAVMQLQAAQEDFHHTMREIHALVQAALAAQEEGAPAASSGSGNDQPTGDVGGAQIGQVHGTQAEGSRRRILQAARPQFAQPAEIPINVLPLTLCDDPPKFGNIDSASEYAKWRKVMETKLELDGHLFPSDKAKQDYVVSRLIGDAWICGAAWVNGKGFKEGNTFHQLLDYLGLLHRLKETRG